VTVGSTGLVADDDRGQLVLIAAVVLAVALVPLVLAYLQLGYQKDVRAGSATGPGAETERTLDRGLQNATSDIAATYDWGNRSEAVATVRERLNSTLTAIEESKLAEGTAIVVTYNQTRTAAWVWYRCPGGPDRQFGPCRQNSGLVIQERNGQTHVLAAAFDVRVTMPERELQFTTVIET
jgi:hypothetical protein